MIPCVVLNKLPIFSCVIPPDLYMARISAICSSVNFDIAFPQPDLMTDIFALAAGEFVIPVLVSDILARVSSEAFVPSLDNASNARCEAAASLVLAASAILAFVSADFGRPFNAKESLALLSSENLLSLPPVLKLYPFGERQFSLLIQYFSRLFSSSYVSQVSMTNLPKLFQPCLKMALDITMRFRWCSDLLALTCSLNREFGQFRVVCPT